MLSIQPSNLQSWTGFILALHLTKNYEQALEALESMLELTKNDKQVTKIDMNNIFDYKCMLLVLMKRFKELTVFLVKNEEQFVDEIAFNEHCATGYLETNNNKKALEHISFLLKKFPDNDMYI